MLWFYFVVVNSVVLILFIFGLCVLLTWGCLF